MVTSQPYVTIYKNQGKGGNGQMTIETNALSEEQFYNAMAAVLPGVMKGLEGDEDFTYLELLPKIADIVCKLRGYKSEVAEERILFAGLVRPPEEMKIGESFTLQPVASSNGNPA